MVIELLRRLAAMDHAERGVVLFALLYLFVWLVTALWVNGLAQRVRRLERAERKREQQGWRVR